MDTSQPGSSVARPAKRSWRRHADEFKARVIELARQGHGSVAAVALANGLNANMLRRWVRESELADATPTAMSTPAVLCPPAFVPVMLAGRDHQTLAAPEPTAAALAAALAAVSAPDLVTVEIRRGAISVSASLPMDERSAAWLREVLA